MNRRDTFKMLAAAATGSAVAESQPEATVIVTNVETNRLQQAIELGDKTLREVGARCWKLTRASSAVRLKACWAAEIEIPSDEKKSYRRCSISSDPLRAVEMLREQALERTKECTS